MQRKQLSSYIAYHAGINIQQSWFVFFCSPYIQIEKSFSDLAWKRRTGCLGPSLVWPCDSPWQMPGFYWWGI